MKFIDTYTGADFEIESFDDLKNFTCRNLEGYLLVGREFIPIKISTGRQQFPFEDC